MSWTSILNAEAFTRRRNADIAGEFRIREELTCAQRGTTAGRAGGARDELEGRMGWRAGWAGGRERT